MSSNSLPYAKQEIDERDIQAVVDVLQSDWLTTGPAVDQFESRMADYVGVERAVAVNSGTAALHAMIHAFGIGPNDEVIVPAMTFAATANAVLYEGGLPVFADVDPNTLLIDVEDVERRITPRTKAVIAVDYAGQPCDYAGLRCLTEKHGLFLGADACHSLGGSYLGQPVGSLADISCFSFHPVKPLTTGEGGMAVTDNPQWHSRMRAFRNHGIEQDHRQRNENGSWFYSMNQLGYNYRLSDLQSALGTSQLSRVAEWTDRRRRIAGWYQSKLKSVPFVKPLECRTESENAYHLFVVRWDRDASSVSRDDAFTEFRKRNIGVNVHYIPVHLHPYYQQHVGTRPGECPVAEAAYQEILSLPMFPAMAESDVDRVVRAAQEICQLNHSSILTQ